MLRSGKCFWHKKYACHATGFSVCGSTPFHPEKWLVQARVKEALNEIIMSKKSLLFVGIGNAILHSLIRALRREEDCTVTTVSSYIEAFNTLQNAQYDLVITKLEIRGEDNHSFIKSLKELTLPTRILILTDNEDLPKTLNYLNLTTDELLFTPCQVEQFVFRIRRCLEWRKLEQLLVEHKQQLAEEQERRRVLEERLQKSDNYFRQALDASSGGVWDRNVLTGEIYHGKNWYQFMGISQEDFTGFSFEDLVHPDDLERVQALREAYISGRSPYYEAEYRLRNEDGSWHWVLSRGQAVTRDKEGRVQRIIGTLTDITRLKQVETDLIQAQAELEQRVQERTAELHETNIALKVVLNKRKEESLLLAEQVLANATKLILPSLDLLQECRLTEKQQVLVDILRTNINELLSPFANHFSTQVSRLTLTEIQVANLVKLGKRTKEIADIMHLSPGTISIHRKNIRKKLDLTHKKTNLTTILSSSS